MSERVTIAVAVAQSLADLVSDLRAALPIEETAAADLATRISRTRAGLTGAVDISELATAIGDLCDIIRDLGRFSDPMQAEIQMGAILPTISELVGVSASPAITLASDLARTVAACIEAAVLAEIAVAVASRQYEDRPSAIAASRRLNAFLDATLMRIAEYGGEDLWHAAETAATHAIDYLSRSASDLKPVVLVGTLRSFPATVIAWRLYGDPSRAQELVQRNAVATPLFMPSSIEALAS